MPERPAQFEGAIRIEWRATEDVMPGWQFRITTADGQPAWNVTDLTIHVPAAGLAWAECVMFADREGKPAYGKTLYLDDDKNILTGTFAFEVAGMSVAAPAP